MSLKISHKGKSFPKLRPGLPVLQLPELVLKFPCQKRESTTHFQEKSMSEFRGFFLLQYFSLVLCDSLSILASCASQKTSPYKGIYSSNVGKTQNTDNR